MAVKAVSAAQKRHWIMGWVYILPVVVGTLLFNVFPLIPTLILSLTNWTGINDPQFIGLTNYAKLFEDKLFYTSVRNTVVFSIMAIPLTMACGLSLAMLVNRHVRGITFFRAAYFLPVVSSMVAVAMVWRWMYNTRYGIINYVLSQFGILGPRWLGDPSTALLGVAFVFVWQQMGYHMVLFLAGLQNIPEELNEAAEIDGASRWKQFRHVTWPLLTPTTFFILIISIIGSFQVFGQIYVMTRGGPGTATFVYVYYLYQNAFDYFRMAYASSLAWILFLVIAAITLFQWRMSKRWVFYQ